MRKRIIKICLFLLAVLITSTFARDVNEKNEYKMAIAFEKSGEYAKAESLFVQLFEADPNNYNYYNRYRNSLILQRKYKDLIPVIKQRLQKRSYDKYLKLELSVAYYANNEEEKARDLWIDVFKGQKQTMRNSYAGTLYHKAMEYGLGNDFHEITKDMRAITSDQRLLVDRDFITSLRYRNWDQAVEEILHILDTDHRELKHVRSNIFRYDPTSALYRRAITALETSTTPYGIELLADIYLHLSEYEKAYDVLSKDHQNEYLKTSMSNFANRMFKQGQYELAAKAARRVETLTPDQQIRKRTMAFLAAQSEEKLFYKLIEETPLIPYPYNSEFLSLKFRPFTSQEAPLIESAYHQYDSLSAYDGLLGEQAAIHHAEISYRIYQDYDAALNELLDLVEKPSLNSKRRVVTQIADLYMAKGEYGKALEFIRTAPLKYRMMVHEEDQLLANEFFVSLIADETDSLLTRSKQVLAMLPMNDQIYNDVLAFSGMINFVIRDSLNYGKWLEAERYILKNNTASAIDIYNELMEGTGSAKKIYALRYLDCLEVQADKETEGIFWQNYYETLLETDMRDYFMLRYASFMEKMQKFDIAYEIFEKYLLSYQESMYYEYIREYVRQHYSLGAP